MIQALTATGPLSEHADKLALFGQFVGSWEILGKFFHSDGSIEEEHEAEWHFGWVLEGRAIQDVLIRPSTAQRAAGHEADEYGTTVRIYDPRIAGWWVVWMAPMSGRVVKLIAREHDDEIWIEGRAPDGDLYRWTFSEISSDRFVWQGYQSSDEGHHWVRGQEMVALRRM